MVKVVRVPKEKKKELLYHPDTRLYEIDGKFYDFKKIKYKKIGKTQHEDVHIYEELDSKELNTLDKLRKAISKKLKDNINPERIIEEVLKGVPEIHLLKLNEQLEKKGTKVSTHEGCYGIEIDSGDKKVGYIEIFE